MSVDALYGLPLQAGQAVAATAGRTAIWALTAYLRAPLRNTAIVALTTFSAMAGSNALYHQSGHHPAPLFGSFEARSGGTKEARLPAMPVPRPAQLLTEPSTETTGSVSPAAVVERPRAEVVIGKEDVFEVQRKLAAFKLFDDKVDGLYGPRTARAIKAFQTSAGLKPTGTLTPELVELIKSTPITAEPIQQAVVEKVAVEPKDDEATMVIASQAKASQDALPAPAPLVSEPAAPQDEVAALIPEAGTGVSSLEMTSPPASTANAPTKRSVQTIAVTAPAEELEAEAAPVVTTPIDVLKSATDPKVVGAIQRGLSSLGFLHGEIDGVAGEATAKAIRNFEVYYNYNVTGRITPELVNLLVQNGAVI